VEVQLRYHCTRCGLLMAYRTHKAPGDKDDDDDDGGVGKGEGKKGKGSGKAAAAAAADAAGVDGTLVSKALRTNRFTYIVAGALTADPSAIGATAVDDSAGVYDASADPNPE
jgi:hypothetical protein